MTVKDFMLLIITYGFKEDSNILNIDFIREIANREIMSEEEFLSHFMPLEDKAAELGIGLETAKVLYKNQILNIAGLECIPIK